MAEPEMMEPSCMARMARNMWPARAIADFFGVSPVVVAGALRDADTAERGIDRKLIVSGKLGRK